MKRSYVLLLVFLLLIGFSTLWISGCGVEPNDDYEHVEDDDDDDNDDDDGFHVFGSTSNHGSYLAANGYPFDQCTACHGANLKGQVSGDEIERSCAECHRSTNHIIDFTNALTEHSGYLRANNWDHTECLVCHTTTGTDADAIFGGSCSSSLCHSADDGGPDACNVCHGSWADNASVAQYQAPPEALDGATATTDPGVGAHRTHLTSSEKFEPMDCVACHIVPATAGAATHIDASTQGVAEVIFHSVGSNDSSNPDYDSQNNTCSNTYCHFSAEPEWTKVDGTYTTCGSCHTLPPPSPHSTRTDCSSCHGLTVNADREIIDTSLHANGVVNLSF